MLSDKRTGAVISTRFDKLSYVVCVGLDWGSVDAESALVMLSSVPPFCGESNSQRVNKWFVLLMMCFIGLDMVVVVMLVGCFASRRCCGVFILDCVVFVVLRPPFVVIKPLERTLLFLLPVEPQD